MGVDIKSNEIRNKILNIKEKKILISKLKNSTQETDITLPVNCEGYGRIRHFRIYEHPDWVYDPLPNYPACNALGIEIDNKMQTQLFQVAGCNWDCWYCFVDDELRKADASRSKYFTSKELISLYLKEQNRPQVIVLSGGQPDLVPEWIYWTIEAIIDKKIEDQIYLWSDDNLSTDFYFKYLTKDQRSEISSYKNYGKVGCFKGFDENSFSYNTNAPRKYFGKQFEYFNKLRLEGLDLYGYVTFTSPVNNNLNKSIDQFVKKLSNIHDKLPLRIIPLKIVDYNTTIVRISKRHYNSLNYQHEVLNNWNQILEEKYSSKERKHKINDIQII